MKQPDAQSRKNIRIQDIFPKSKEKERAKSNKRDPANSVEYGTDSKVQSHNQSNYSEMEEMRAVMQSCPSCKDKFSQFTTKKPKKQQPKDQKSTQTSNKPFLINLIEERVNEMCKQNRKLSKLLVDKEGQLLDRQNEIAQIEDKFTNILYTLGQDISQLKSDKRETDEVIENVPYDSETPSYLKALIMDGKK